MVVVLIALGLIPFALGGLLQWILSLNNFLLAPAVLIVISLVTLLIWGVLAYLIKPYIKSTSKVMLGMHVIPLLVLLLHGIQGPVLHQYWPNFLGLLTQIYYLPLVRIASILTSWMGTSMFLICLVSFLLMVGVSFAGCKLNKK